MNVQGRECKFILKGEYDCKKDMERVQGKGKGPAACFSAHAQQNPTGEGVGNSVSEFADSTFLDWNLY